MDETAMDVDFLRGKQVAFTGRLASMTRTEAAELVQAFGGRFVRGLNRQTSFLVVGQEGWPLCKNGRLTRRLQRAQMLRRRGHAVNVLSEEDWLVHLGLDARCAGIRRLYSFTELSQLLKVSRSRLRVWIKAGLIQPVEKRHGIAYFDYRQVTGARTLCSLIKAGVSVQRIRRSLEQLPAWAGKIEQPLVQLATLEKDGSLLVRVGDRLAEPTGQLLLEFSDGRPAAAVAFSEQRLSADEWFALACQHEDEGRLQEAATGYRQALLVGGPDFASSFNLANVLCALGRKQEAAERFYQLVEAHGEQAEVWNNLGTVLVDLRRFDEAKAAYEQAIQRGYTDAHYNLADLLRELGEPEQARRHWQAYLQQDQHSKWARYARSCLGLAR